MQQSLPMESTLEIVPLDMIGRSQPRTYNKAPIKPMKNSWTNTARYATKLAKNIENNFDVAQIYSNFETGCY